MNIPPPLTVDLFAPDLPGQITTVPAAPGLYQLWSETGTSHLSSTANLRKRLKRLLLSSHGEAGSLIARLRRNLTRIDIWPAGSKLEILLLSYELSRISFPADYLKRLRLQMPWFVGLTTDPFPRLAISNRLSRACAQRFGPFRNRDAAQHYEQQTLALFQIRRCTEVLAPHPEHPGCIYGEMNQCLRPCQRAVTEAEYAAESKRVAAFLSNNGKSSLAALSTARDRACAEMEFEQAAQIHKRMEKITAAAAARDEVITDADHLNGLALTRVALARTVRLWPMLGACWQEPVTLDFSSEDPQPKSLDRHIRDRLEEALQNLAPGRNRLEDAALFSRWYYSSWRDGLWFPFKAIGDLNYGRLVRKISSVLKTGPDEPGEVP